jgi:hypothetical protein
VVPEVGVPSFLQGKLTETGFEPRGILSEAPRPQGGASRQCNIIYIVPLYPAYPARAGRGTFRSRPNHQAISFHFQALITQALMPQTPQSLAI